MQGAFRTMNNALYQWWQDAAAPFDGDTVGFDAEELTSLAALRQVLLAVVPALQKLWPNTKLLMLDDWHEHDGYVSNEQPVTWQELSQL